MMNNFEWILEPKFRRTSAINNGLVVVTDDENNMIISEKGELVVRLEDHIRFFGDPSDDLIPAAIAKRNPVPWTSPHSWGFLNLDGNWELEPKFDRLTGFNNGLAIFKRENLNVPRNGHNYVIQGDVGFLNRVFETELSGFVGADPFIDGIAHVTLSYEYGTEEFKFLWQGGTERFGHHFIDRSGTEIFSKVFGDAKSLTNGCAPVVEAVGQHWKLIALDGTQLFEQDFYEIWPYRDDLARFESKPSERPKKFGFIDLNGEIVLETEFGSLTDFSFGFAGFCGDNGQYGFMNRNGKVVVEPQFETISDSCGADGYWAVQIQNRWGHIKLF